MLLPDNENRMAPDILFGSDGSGAVNPRALSARTDKNILELYAMDVDTDGTVYLSCNGSLAAVQLKDNGTAYKALWESNGYDEGQGAIAVVGRYILTAINGGEWPDEGMAWMKDTGYWSFTRQSGRIGYDAERMNAYVHMRYVNGTLYIADRGEGVDSDAIDPNADKIWAVAYIGAADEEDPDPTPGGDEEDPDPAPGGDAEDPDPTPGDDESTGPAADTDAPEDSGSGTPADDAEDGCASSTGLGMLGLLCAAACGSLFARRRKH